MRLDVLITYYNEKELLTECLHSLFKQGFNGKVFVYDDASPSRAESFVPEGYRSQTELVRSHRNLGPAVGRNVLLKLSGAEFVHFQDADDLFRAGWCGKVEALLKGKDPDLLLTELDSTQGGKPYGKSFLGLKELAADPDLVRFCLKHPVLPAAGTYKREFLNRVGGYREDLWQSEDYEFHTRLALRGARYALCLDPLVEVRVRPASRSQKQKEVWLGRLQGLEILAVELKSKYSLALAEAFLEVGQRLFRLGEQGLAKKAFSQAGAGLAYRQEQVVYRAVALRFGPYVAEWLGGFYRALIPRFFRQTARKWLLNLK
jgi:GT2 family glycosyltransferase